MMMLRRNILFIEVQVFIVLFTAVLTAQKTNDTKNGLTSKIWNLAWTGFNIHNERKFFSSLAYWGDPVYQRVSGDSTWKNLDRDFAKFFPGSNGEVKIDQKNWNTSEWIGPDFFNSFTRVKMCFMDYPAFEINNQILFPSDRETYIVKKSGGLVTLISENNENLKTAFNFDNNTGKLEFDPPGSNNNNKCTVKQEIYKSNARAVVLFLGGKRQVSVTKDGSVFNVTYENKDGNNEFDINVYNWLMNLDLTAKFFSYKNGTDKNAKKFLLMTQEKQNHIILGLPQCENNTINNCFFENETISDIDSAIEIINKNNEELNKRTTEENNDNQNGIPDEKIDSTDKEDDDFTETEMDQKKISDTPIDTDSTSDVTVNVIIETTKDQNNTGDKSIDDLPESTSETKKDQNNTADKSIDDLPESTSETKKDQNNTADKHVDDLPELPSDVVVNDNDLNDKNNPEVEKEKGGVSGLLIFIYTAIALTITAVFILGAWWLLKRNQQRNATPGFTNLLVSKRL